MALDRRVATSLEDPLCLATDPADESSKGTWLLARRGGAKGEECLSAQATGPELHPRTERVVSPWPEPEVLVAPNSRLGARAASWAFRRRR